MQKNNNKIIKLISIKPNTFHNKYWQYIDVFLGLEFASKETNIDWEIFYKANNSFKSIKKSDLNEQFKEKIITNYKKYRNKDLNELKGFANE